MRSKSACAFTKQRAATESCGPLFFVLRTEFPVFVKKSAQGFVFMYIFAPEGKQDRNL
jgi:hypothetical protein